MSIRYGTPLSTVDSFCRTRPPMTAVCPSSTITRVFASAVTMTIPPCTVACAERSETSGRRSSVTRLSWLMCGVTDILIPIVVSSVMALPASSEITSGIFLPTRMFASRLSIVMMRGLLMILALFSFSRACSVRFSSPKSRIVPSLNSLTGSGKVPSTIADPVRSALWLARLIASQRMPRSRLAR